MKKNVIQGFIIRANLRYDELIKYKMIVYCHLLYTIVNKTNSPTLQQCEYFLSWRNSCLPQPAAEQIHLQSHQRNTQYCKEQEAKKGWQRVASLPGWLAPVIDHLHYCKTGAREHCYIYGGGCELMLSQELIANFEAFACSTSSFHCSKPSNILIRGDTV